MAGIVVEEKFLLPGGHIYVLMDDELGIEIIGENGIDGDTVGMESWDFTNQDAWKEWGACCMTAIELNKRMLEDGLCTEEQVIDAIYALEKNMSDKVKAALVPVAETPASDKAAIVNMMEISTANLQEATAKALQKDEIPGIVSFCKKDYGWFVFIPDYILHEDLYDKEEIPDELHEAMVYAHKRGCEWIMFDYDVEPVEELPTFEW